MDIPQFRAASEIPLKKASFELRETLARAKCQVEGVSAALHTYPVDWAACHPSSKICSFIEQMFTQYLMCLGEQSEQDRLRPSPLGTWWGRQAGSQTRQWNVLRSTEACKKAWHPLLCSLLFSRHLEQRLASSSCSINASVSETEAWRWAASDRGFREGVSEKVTPLSWALNWWKKPHVMNWRKAI